MHGDPIQRADPTGKWFGVSVGFGLGARVFGAVAGAAAGAAIAYFAGGDLGNILSFAAVGAAIGAFAFWVPGSAFVIAAVVGINHISGYLRARNKQRIVPVPAQIADEGRTYMQFANLAYDVRIPPNGDAIPAGWVFEEAFVHADAPNYDARAYRNLATGEIVMAYARTDDATRDVVTDIFQGVRGGGRDYEYAIEDAAKLIDQFPGAPIRFVGHSLGGGMAAAAAAVHGMRATTCNAAGVHPATVAAHGANLAGLDQSVNAFRVQGEFLSTFQDAESFIGSMMPDSNGTAYYLPGSGSLFARHGRDSLFAGLEKI